MLRRSCLFVLTVRMIHLSPSIGAYLIVRNGESTVETAIKSVLPAVSQLIVVDTGSDDATVPLCSRLGAEIHFFAWTHSFAHARNYALGLMRTDWVIAIDADEVIDLSSFEAARPLLLAERTGALRTAIYNRLSEGETTSIHHYPRIFRSHPAIRYTGAIHEQIGEAVARAGFSIVDSPVAISHEGYAHPSQEKIDRNTALLRSELAIQPSDPWLHYHLGLTEFAAHHYAGAASCLAYAVESGALSREQYETASIRLAQIALGNEDWKEFEKRISFAGSNEQTEGFRLYLDAVRSVVVGDMPRARVLLSTDAVEHSRLVDRDHLLALRNLCTSHSNTQ